jgi:hypothetical protein
VAHQSEYAIEDGVIVNMWACEEPYTGKITPEICNVFLLRRSRDNAVGIATGYELDDRGVGVRVPAG